MKEGLLQFEYEMKINSDPNITNSEKRRIIYRSRLKKCDNLIRKYGVEFHFVIDNFMDDGDSIALEEMIPCLLREMIEEYEENDYQLEFDE